MTTKKKGTTKKKKQTFVGKLQTFDANREIKVTQSMTRLASPQGTASNKVKLQLARAAAKGLARATIKKNKAKHK